MGRISAVPAQGNYAVRAFTTGFLDGYNTMDALASLAFGIVVINVIRGEGVTKPGAIARNTVKAGAFSCLFINNTLALGLCVIYAFFNIKSNLKKTKEEKK